MEIFKNNTRSLLDRESPLRVSGGLRARTKSSPSGALLPKLHLHRIKRVGLFKNAAKLQT